MCGRFTLKTDPKVIASQFQVSSIAILEGRIADLTSPAKKLDQIESDPKQMQPEVFPHFAKQWLEFDALVPH